MLSPETLIRPAALIFEHALNPPRTTGLVQQKPDYELGSADNDSGVLSLGTLANVSPDQWSNQEFVIADENLGLSNVGNMQSEDLKL